MGSFIRSVLGIPVAAIIVGGLFLVMYSLVRPPEEAQVDNSTPPNIKIGRQIDDSAVVNQKKFERPALDTPPPPPPAIVQKAFNPRVDGVRATAPSFAANVNVGTAFNPDRDAQPIVRIPPSETDFQRCIRSDRPRTERVSLEFDVSPQGQVVNVKVVDSSDSCYNRSAVRAAQKWKYNPKVVDGETQPRYGVRTVIRYEVGGG